MAKYSLVAYVLWLFLGFLGVHHFYLGRDHQGILWLTSLGGFFGIGWFRDFASIPRYVKEANGDPEYLEKLRTEMKWRKRPSIWANITRVFAQVCFGCFYRAIVLAALPEEYGSNGFLILILAPLGTAFGTYMVSNIGAIKSRWGYSLMGAYLGELAFGRHHYLLETPHPSLAAGLSMLFSTFAWEFDRSPKGGVDVVDGGDAQRIKCCRGPKGACCRRLAVWTLVLLVFSGLLISAVYFNASITTSEGETVKVREAISNFFKSPYWRQLKQSFWADFGNLWREYRENGWEAAFRRLMVMADIQGEERSRLILGVSTNATLSEVKAKYRDLAKEWHPDRHASGTAEYRAEAQEKFMEINEAYETLQKIYKRRTPKGWSS